MKGCLLLASLLSSCASAAFHCQFESRTVHPDIDTGVNSTFDLSAIELELEWKAGGGTIFDLRAGDCFSPAAAEISAHTTCHPRDGSPRPATAVQWMDDGGCHRLGDAQQPVNKSWALRSSRVPPDPADGLQLELTGGDPCGELGSRNTTVVLMCNSSASISEIVSVDEPSTCHYVMRVTSPHACPLSTAEARMRLAARLATEKTDWWLDQLPLLLAVLGVPLLGAFLWLLVWRRRVSSGPSAGCCAGSLWDPTPQTVKCYYHRVGTVGGPQDDTVTAIVRVNLDQISDAGHLQKALAYEAGQAGEVYDGGFVVQYEDEDADHVTLTQNSDLSDVRRFAQKIHIFQPDPTKPALETEGVEKPQLAQYQSPVRNGSVSPLVAPSPDTQVTHLNEKDTTLAV